MKQYLTSDPEILSGKLVIKGTRIPVARIVQLLKEGYTVDLIQEDYPHIEKETIERALAEIIQILDNKENASELLQTQTSPR